MGSAQSSEIKRNVVDLAPTSSSDVGSDESDNWVPLNNETDDISCDDDDSDDDDEERLEERLRILEDSRKLRMMADFFLHPEKPVKTEPVASARCYFDRFSAPQQISQYEADETAKIVAEAKALHTLAVDYLHPELPIQSSDCACARCYFERASAPEQEFLEDDQEKRLILTELGQLKKAAFDYLHPEAPINASDPNVFGRNFFNRPSAPRQFTQKEEEERQLILEDAKALGKLATYYLHPEAPVVSSDPTIFGRNYFSRPSAPEQEERDDKERQLILEDAKALGKLATYYLHPEAPVVTSDPTIFGRNYFNRPSAPEQESADHEGERKQVLADALRLKELALNYLHPELPVKTSDPTVFARNYFTRPSVTDATGIHSKCDDTRGDYYYHHAHFDMEDDIYAHHAEFDRNPDHHHEISEVRVTTPTTTRTVITDFDPKLSISPGCVMTLAQPRSTELPHLHLAS